LKNRYCTSILALTLASSAFSQTPSDSHAANANERSPIYGVAIPPGYREWQAIAPALETVPLDELRMVLANPAGFKAFRDGKLPFPDGTVLVKLAYKRTPSPNFKTASFPGAPTTVQIMVKDSQKYAGTGGWGFGRFIDGKPADLAQHQTCFACHQTLAAGHDLVITRFAP
jgi:hypothetical protein